MRAILVLFISVLVSLADSKRRGRVLEFRNLSSRKVRKSEPGLVSQTSILKALADDAVSEQDLMTKTSKKFASLSNKLKLILRE